MRALPKGIIAAVLVASTACGNPSGTGTAAPSPSTPTSPSPSGATKVSVNGLPGMPEPIDAGNVYAATAPGMLAAHVKGHRPLVYVPNTNDDTVSVVDPATFKVIATFPGGPEPQHVVPSYDLRTLWVAADRVPEGSVTPVDPATGRPGKRIEVQDVYNLYFTPDGKYAVVVAEAYQRLDFYDPATWQRRHSMSFPTCKGINHMDYSADGRTALIACEFANRMVVLDVENRRHLRTLELNRTPDGMPQDTRLAPDGTRFYTADMMAGGVYVFTGDATTQIGFIPTGHGAHGIYFSRDGRRMFVTNRGEGSVSVLDPATGKVRTKWWIPGNASPDMGALSADGTQLWLSGRYHDEVYVLDAGNGGLLARIKVGSGPHGLLYWPQPGRYSLGHTANLR